MTDHTAEILLIEDSPDDAAFFKHTFAKSNLVARLNVVGDGAEALEFISSTGRHAGRNHAPSPRIIVLDLKLPKLDGLQVLRRLKSDPRTWNIPIVVFSSSEEESDLVASYKLGVNSYIVKPMDFDEFTESVQRLVEYWLRFNRIPKL
ncbi:MAG: response regulator [Verrucomicrobia bacterium]|nr:response regulator [Verrucomicrobiota bacterium]